MPTYEYRCTSCGFVFEEFQKITDPPLTVCPECSGTVQRVIGPGSGIIFKGSGFYATDYRSKGYREKEKQEKQKENPPAKNQEHSRKETTK